MYKELICRYEAKDKEEVIDSDSTTMTKKGDEEEEEGEDEEDPIVKDEEYEEEEETVRRNKSLPRYLREKLELLGSTGGRLTFYVKVTSYAPFRMYGLKQYESGFCKSSHVVRRVRHLYRASTKFDRFQSFPLKTLLSRTGYNEHGPNRLSANTKEAGEKPKPVENVKDLAEKPKEPAEKARKAPQNVIQSRLCASTKDKEVRESKAGDEDDITFVVDGMWWAKSACILAGQYAVVLAAMAGCDETLTCFSGLFELVYVLFHLLNRLPREGCLQPRTPSCLQPWPVALPFSLSRVRKSELIVSWKTHSVRVDGWLSARISHLSNLPERKGGKADTYKPV
ncbi:hypothetical protein Tco_1123704 [Tanacetum coccineum]|uniref:Uncharacterized protein n=1 Tax=Tanacetum coccineum TaxID=301880 RepID=A0ABQ5J7X9_9ASTR